MVDTNLDSDLLENVGGVDVNNLNSVLKLDSKYDEHIESFSPSNYYDIESFMNSLKKRDRSFTTLSLNIESLRAKFTQLSTLIHTLTDNDCHLDAILIQETWLTDIQCKNETLELYNIPGYQAIPLGRQCGRKGGLMIYLNEIYSYTPRQLYTPSIHWEGLFIDITHKHNEVLPNKIILANIYRPPRDNNSNSSIDRFLQPFSDVFNILCQENATLAIGGDFNVNLLKLNEREKFQEYFDLFVGNGCNPQITMPTRFSKKSATLIDQIFCRFSKYSSHNFSGILVTKISDHLPCFSTINFLNNVKYKPKYIKIQKSGPEALQAFQDEIKLNISTSTFKQDLLSDPNENYNALESIIINAKKKCFPIREVKFDKYKHKVSPWITFGIINSIKFRDKLYVKWKKTKLSSPNYILLENSYKSYCALLQKSIRLAKSEYYHKQFENFKLDIKKTWNQINELLSRKNKTKELPKYFSDNNRIITENIDIANCFNNFFCNIGPSLANSIKSPENKSYKDYLKQNILSVFTFNTVTSEHILKCINKLKSKSSFGHDGLSSIHLKYISHEIVPVLTHIINQSLCTGIFPDTLKTAKITPVFKKGDQHITDNYRPISLLPVISKIFEKVVFLQVYEYFTENKLLYENQYGFRKYHSTELASLEFTDKIILNLDEGKIPVSLYLDLSKAFDTIDHSILLYKLQYYGIRGVALKWFESYLSNRKQYVQFNEGVSSNSEITTGVPQGSILGPLLFIIYMNDIAKVTDKFHFTLYADDTSLIEPLCTFTSGLADKKEAANAINKELNLITDWLCLNKLSLNAKKTKMMIFHHRQKNISDIDLSLYINGTKIEQVQEFNFLGLVLDECMTWNSHIQKISGKIAVVNGALSRLKKILPSDILKTIYNALVQPHLNFGVLLWGKNVKRILKLQKWAVRAICSSKYNAHTDPLFIKLKLLKIHDIYKLGILKFYYKYQKGLLPGYFSSMFDHTYPTHDYATRFRDQPQTARCNTMSAKNSIRYALPEIVSNTPLSIVSKIFTHSPFGFANYAKSYFINQYKPICVADNCYICNPSL